jgi:hypothetical protein
LRLSTTTTSESLDTKSKRSSTPKKSQKVHTFPPFE